ncbi:uncharacterized protein At2g29880-like [Bidens hawaiensis]|uniref:uncharacterized protein At2g29880-like n=1 Tax=Bidens hawaiensis TaxID=980011 RepID=UPI00404A5FA2
MSNHNRTYHGWTSIEDAKLVEALVNMVNAGGFKSDNGFKPGYLLHLEQSLKESLPESGILGKPDVTKPHIESRIKTLKKDWQIVFDMLNATSGFGYDKEKNCVTTNVPGVWESYLENHREATKWQNKKLPHYEELCVIFGKDRALGNRAKSVIEMEDELNNEDHEHEQEQERDDDFDVEMEDNHDGNNSTPSVQVEETSSVCTKKRKDISTSNSMHKSFNDAVYLFADRLKESSKELSEGINLS